jgi:hypothetical protein
MTSAERQRKFKQAQAEKGLVQVNVWVPAGCKADIERAAELIRERRQLTVARLVDTTTGRLVGLKR